MELICSQTWLAVVVCNIPVSSKEIIKPVVLKKNYKTYASNKQHSFFFQMDITTILKDDKWLITNHG